MIIGISVDTLMDKFLTYTLEFENNFTLDSP